MNLNHTVLFVVTVKNEFSYFDYSKHIFNSQALALAKVRELIEQKADFTYQSDANNTEKDVTSELLQAIDIIHCTSEYYNIEVTFLEHEILVNCCNSYMI